MDIMSVLYLCTVNSAAETWGACVFSKLYFFLGRGPGG